MGGQWTPKQYVQLIAGGTACVCMLLVVAGLLLAIINNTISPSILGDWKSGAGLVGVLLVFYGIITRVLK